MCFIKIKVCVSKQHTRPPDFCRRMTSIADVIANEAIKVRAEECWDPIRLHITDFHIEQSPLTNTPVDIRLVKEESLEQFCEATIALMENEKHPLHISVDCLHQYFMEESTDDLMAAVRAVTDAAVESKRHRVTFSTLRYCPDLERHWSCLGQLNNRIRQHTIDSGEQLLSLHKIFLNPRSGSLETFGETYEEFARKSSLGSTPSELGAQIVLSWVVRHHQNAYMATRVTDNQKKLAPLPMPIPLSMSPDYASSDFMVSVLKSRGMFCGRRTRSTSRRGAPRRTSHRTISRDRSNSAVSGARPRGARSPASLGALERLLHQVSRNDASSHHQNRERDAGRVTDRLALLYRQKCEENTRLSLEVESQKLEIDLLHEKNRERESELVNVRAEVQNLRNTIQWQEARTDRIKGELNQENRLLEDELANLKLSKKGKKQAKKEKRRRHRN